MKLSSFSGCDLFLGKSGSTVETIESLIAKLPDFILDTGLFGGGLFIDPLKELLA